MPEIETHQIPPATRKASKEELNAYIRQNVIKTVLSLLVLFLVLAALGKVYETELLAVAHAVYEAVGLWGLLGLLFVADAIFSPVPPDVVLVVIANSALRTEALWVIPLVGLASTLAGNLAWYIGWRFAKFPWANRRLSHLRLRHADRIQRYDRWSVALGATTPLPFSVTCIAAGALGMSWRRIAPMTLLRIPRFIVFYLVIAYSTMF